MPSKSNGLYILGLFLGLPADSWASKHLHSMLEKYMPTVDLEMCKQGIQSQAVEGSSLLHCARVQQETFLRYGAGNDGVVLCLLVISLPLFVHAWGIYS
jgi:hypothetical protein